MSLAAFALLTFDDALAQAAFPPPPPKVSPAAGVIDMHVHSHPDVFGRNMDDIDVAQLAKSRGMRGIVLKNHISETASRAALVMKVVPGIEVFGGIVLNKAVGGVNPNAVEWMHRFYGGRGKVVWLPTFESDKHVKTFSQARLPRASSVAPNGQVTPEMEAILQDHRAREPRARHRSRPSRGDHRGGAARARARREEHGRHPWLDQRAGSHHGAGQRGHRHGRADRGLLPPVPGRAERVLCPSSRTGRRSMPSTWRRRRRSLAQRACWSPRTSARAPT